MKQILIRKALVKRLTSCALSLLLLASSAGSVFAQSDTGRIEGTVTDASNAVMAGAIVAAVNAQTNIRAEAKTNDEGHYVLTPLRVGTYTLEVSAQGFHKFEQKEIVLTVNQVARIDVKLAAGNVSEVVTVTSGAPLVESGTSSLGTVIQEQKIVDLPLNGRNFTQLATLVPGVTRGVLGGNADGSGGNAETFRQGETGSAALSANGLREQNNNFQLDGIDNNESIVNTIVFFPPIEALEEFRVITSVAPAEFGRGGGAIVNAVIKSGGNTFHGSAFEFLRNSALDARPTFSSNKPLFIRNQFGGTFGGPIVRDKAFFFVDYQGLRQRLPIEAGNRITVPTAKMRVGDFSELLNPNFTGLGNPVIIYNPNTGVPFPNNKINIPLNPITQKYLSVFPLPDFTDRAQGNYLVRRLRQQSFKDGDARVDYHISDKNLVFGRFSIADDVQTDPGRIPDYHAGFGSGTNQVKANSVAFNYTRTFSARLINEARFGYVRHKIEFLPVNFGIDQTSQLGIGGQSGITAAEVGGITLIGGGDGRFIEYLGDGGPYRLNERTLQFSDALSYIAGNHTFKFGATIIQRHIGSLQSDLGKGFYFFDDFQATPGNIPGKGRTGYEVAEMLIGRTSFTTAAFVTPTTAINFENGFFAQDDWRASRRLTLNLGLRYDLLAPPHEANDRLANYDPSTMKLVIPGNGVPGATVDTDKNNFGPRVGLAYDLTGDGKTVLRGGYGVFYSLDRGGIANQLTQNPPFNTEEFRFFFGDVTAGGIAAGGQIRLGDPIPKPTPVDPAVSALPTGSKVRFIPRDTRNTLVQQYNVTFERELTSRIAMNIAYVGTHGANVTAVTTQSGFGGDIAGLITTIANIGHSTYNSLQIKVSQRSYDSGMLRGLSYLAAYTYGKARNDSPGAFPGTGGAFRQTPADAGGLAAGPADYDVRHRFTFAGTYELPFARESKGAAHALLYGWQANSIVTLQTGTPFSVFGGAGRAKLIGDPNATDQRADMWFNPKAFAESANAAEQSPRNFLSAPGIAGVDASLFRKFRFTERFGAEFRAEAFNLFNHPQLGVPNIFCCGGDFGRITTTRLNSERQIQFGLRLFF